MQNYLSYQDYLPYLFGVLALILLWFLVGREWWNPWKLVEGADGRSSTSKLQWFLWTVVIVFSYTVIYSARALKGHFEPITDIPVNLLIAMGLSITTVKRVLTRCFLLSWLRKPGNRQYI